MGKRRKQNAPRYVGSIKRQELTWNMSDPQGSQSNSNVNDHTLKDEDNMNSSGHHSPESCSLVKEGGSGCHSQASVHALCFDAFYQNLAFCQTTLTLQCPSSSKMCNIDDKLLEFGKFRITLIDHPPLTPLPEQLPDYNECWLYLASEGQPNMLYFETEDNDENINQHRKKKSRQSKFGTFWFVDLSVPVAVLSSAKSKNFLFHCSTFDSHLNSMNVTVYSTDDIIVKLSHPSEAIKIKTTQLTVQKLMEFYFDISLPYNYENLERVTSHDFSQLYENVSQIHRQQLIGDVAWPLEVKGIGHSCLKPTLRHYQRESVAWMLRQERRNVTSGPNKKMHPLYCQVKFNNGTQLYYNRHAGSLIRDFPSARDLLPGGILADEMGLGKTVEVLCCMLLNPRLENTRPEPLPVLTDTPAVSPEVPSVPENSSSPQSTDQLDLPDSNLTVTTDTESKDESGLGFLNEGSLKLTESQSLEDKRFNCDENTDGIHEFAKSQCDGLELETFSENRNENSTEEHSLLNGCENSKITPGGTVDLKKIEEENMPILESCNREIIDDTTVETVSPVITPAKPSGKSTAVAGKTTQISLLDRSCVMSVDPSLPTTASSSLINPPQSPITSSSDNSKEPFNDNLSDGIDKTNHKEIKKKKSQRKRCYVEYVPLTDANKVNIFNAQPVARKQLFECNCGQLESEGEALRRRGDTVTCVVCGMSQHAECMNYDLQDPYRGEYLCPHCHAMSSSIKSKATLIISPYSICHQWIDEIRKHITERSIKVFIYTGVSKLGFIQPHTLAKQDIVITTYDVLKKELDFANLPHNNSETGRRFRHPKRFLATPSPLVAVEWWRICLDEAQMVETVTTKTAEMALRLKAVNRWCVTGTPLMRSVEDIYGLLTFLGMDPYLVQQWFRLLVWEPYCHGFTGPMHHSLAQVMWRTAKKDVVDQIDLPGQTEEVKWLTFSPVEEHFYRRQKEEYQRSSYFHRRNAEAQSPHTKLHSLDRKTMNDLLFPLFRLRQACCHPQIVRGEFLPLNKKMMTMSQVLEHMTKKVKTECEEAHRQLVASLNGQAGLFILRGKLASAVDKYRCVLQSVEEHGGRFRTDDLQQLHAMYNLAMVLKQKPAGVAPTLRDASLEDQCHDLKVKYRNKVTNNMATTKETCQVTRDVVRDLSRKLMAMEGDWWADVVEMADLRALGHELISKVKDDLLKTSATEGTIAESFNSPNGLMYVVETHLQALVNTRASLTTGLDKLVQDTSAVLVEQAATCCLRPLEDVLKSCPFCQVDELFNDYESKLFLFVERGVTVTGDDNSMAYQVSTKRQGTWADSEVEKLLKSILSFYKSQFDTDAGILRAASLHVKYLDSLKKEFKHLRATWLAHRELVSAFDELAMATERLRLRDKSEPESTTKILNVIEERDMTQHELKCQSDEIVGRDDLRKKLGQLVYLTNLASRSDAGSDTNVDACPICQCQLGLEWAVLMCGHCYCIRCARTLIDRMVGGNLQAKRLKCPVCRDMTPVRDISYVTTKKAETVNVRGSHSTKVQAVVECLIMVREKEPKAKTLVFSAWVSVLDIIAKALAENQIVYKCLHEANHFQENLSAFKTSASISVLLLPFHTGANGLNLVEASHVVLVEPSLSIEEEAQAISRVFRMGQSRRTTIHRFMVRGTIEEKMFHMVKTLKSEVKDEEVELTVGHITSLLHRPSPDEDGEEEEAAEGEGEEITGESHIERTVESIGDVDTSNVTSHLEGDS